MVSIHFMYGINGSNRMLVVTPEDQNVRAWVKIVQAMIADLLELNHDPSIVKVIGDVGEEGSYNVFEVLYRYFEYCVEGNPVFGIWLKSNPATWLFMQSGYLRVHPGASYGMRAAFLCRQFVFSDSILKQKKSSRQPIYDDDFKDHWISAFDRAISDHMFYGAK